VGVGVGVGRGVGVGDGLGVGVGDGRGVGVGDGLGVGVGDGLGVGVGDGRGVGVGDGLGVGVGEGLGVGPVFCARAFVLSRARSSGRRDRIAATPRSASRVGPVEYQQRDRRHDFSPPACRQGLTVYFAASL